MSYVSLILPLLAAPGASGLVALAEAGVAEGQARLEELLRQVQAGRAAVQEELLDLRRNLRQAVSHPERPVDGDIDEAIAFIERVEPTRAADHAALLRIAEANAVRTASLPPPLRDLAAEISRVVVNAHADYLDGLRDVRWELLAHRAEREAVPSASASSEGFDVYLDRLLRD